MGKPTGRGKRRLLLWKMQDLRCAACGGVAHINLGGRHPLRLTVDEVTPRSKGGLRVLGNQLVMHKCCNEAKADRDPSGCELIWLELVNARLRKRGKLA